MTKNKRTADEKADLRDRAPAPQQFAALCHRARGKKIEILLITSRGTGRWILPKGWAIKSLSKAATAAQEAREEAGVIGEIRKKPVGSYEYCKLLDSGLSLQCDVEVYPLEVDRLEDDYLEKDQRERHWFSQKKAATLVDEPELRSLIRAFTP
ncbi:NUDIX hydrolase [Hoeflea poritis]|uniref:NUDIX hydrolase n=1 Tax=Hoeflea poritis TaxID=2993659 RepID=A0ABT4VIJ6_9HYPH|nr:NUDIX hydrolase [Hoeflea poritis]MDA4843952.1 NUDIX hydrolase [Hoeflea poritis]